MLSGTRAPPMVGLLVTQAGWPLLPRHQAGQPRPTVSPSRGSGTGSRGDRRPDDLLMTLIVVEVPVSDRKG